MGCFQLHISVFASLKDRVLEWKEVSDILDSKAFTVQVSKNQAPRGLSLCTASPSQPLLSHSTPLLLRFPFTLYTGASPLPCPQAALSPLQVAPRTTGTGGRPCEQSPFHSPTRMLRTRLYVPPSFSCPVLSILVYRTSRHIMAEVPSAEVLSAAISPGPYDS